MPVGGGIVSNLFGLVSGLLFRGATAHHSTPPSTIARSLSVARASCTSPHSHHGGTGAGIRLVQMPTTFLNAHDAVTSKKQAVNHAGYKNIVGMFHLPSLVLVDTGYFATLGQQEFKSGLGELTKNAALFGKDHYELMKSTVLDHGWQITAEEQTEAVFS
eukprot:SAG31_NODE_11939_length_983_cov_2.643665_3_plen_159_part_01